MHLLSHLTFCTPTKSNLYLGNSTATAVSEPDPFRLLTLHAPSLMSLYHCLGHRKGIHICFVTRPFFTVRPFSTSPNLQTGRSPLVDCPRLLIQYIHNYPPYWWHFLQQKKHFSISLQHYLGDQKYVMWPIPIVCPLQPCIVVMSESVSTWLKSLDIHITTLLKICYTDQQKQWLDNSTHMFSFVILYNSPVVSRHCSEYAMWCAKLFDIPEAFSLNQYVHCQT